LNFWAVAVVVPALVAGPRDLWAAVLVAFPLPLLALAARRRDALSALVLFPTSVTAAIGALPAHTFGSPYPPLPTLLAAASLWLYGAVCARIVTRVECEPSVSEPLTPGPRDAEALRRRRGQRRLLVFGGAGALLLAVLAPRLGGAPRRDWGEAAEAAQVLTAVVAAALATVGLGAFLGPATRRRRRPISRRRSTARAALLLLVVVAGLIVWAIMIRDGA